MLPDSIASSVDADCSVHVVISRGRSIGNSAELCKNVWTSHEPILGVDLCGPKETCIRHGTYWRHLANTVKQSMLSGDAGCRYHYCSNLFYDWG